MLAKLVRDEGEKKLRESDSAHETQLERMRQTAIATEALRQEQLTLTQNALLQEQQDRENSDVANSKLREIIAAKEMAEAERKTRLLKEGFSAGARAYDRIRWLIAILFGVISGGVAFLSTDQPILSTVVTTILGIIGFWFVPDMLHGPLNAFSMSVVRRVVWQRDSSIDIPTQSPDFRDKSWGVLG